MDEREIRLAIQLIVSAALVVGVLWFMWRLPQRHSESFYRLAPILALGSAWIGLTAVVVSSSLWWVLLPDRWLVIVFLLLDPLSIGVGVLVLWTYRGYDVQSPSYASAVRPQCWQAWVGIVMGLVAVVVGYCYVMTHKTPFTPVGI